MSALPVSLTGRLFRLAVFAYRSLLLALLFVALVRLAFGEGGWFNDFVVALMLCLPLAARAAWRRAGSASLR